MKWLLISAKKCPYALIGIGLTLILLNGCGVKLVADYDTATYDSILSTAKQVDTFYVKLLVTPENEREYKKNEGFQPSRGGGKGTQTL